MTRSLARKLRTRPKTREETWEGTVCLAVFTGLLFTYSAVFGWNGWMTLAALLAASGSTAVLLFITGFVRGMARDLWPAVPPDLAPKVVSLRAGGWSVARAHLWQDCAEERPHVHMTHRDHGPLILIWDGTTVLDACGNVIRHEF